MATPRRKVVSALEWLEEPTTIPHLTFITGTDEWVIELLLDKIKVMLEIEDLEYGYAILHTDDITPEAAMDALRGGSLLYSGRKLIFLRGTPSGRNDRLKKTLEHSVVQLDEMTFVVWQIDEYDASRNSKVWPYSVQSIQPGIIIRFDERSDDEMVSWTKHLLKQSALLLSLKGIQQLANSAQFPYELNSIVEQLKVWADDTGKITDDVFNRLALGEINAVVEEVAFYLLTGDSAKMMSAIYRLDEQIVSRNATTILWRLGSILHECWYWLLPPKADEGQKYRWNPYQRLFQDLEPHRKQITEAAIWETLSDLASLDTALKTTGAFQQEYRLLVQTLLPSVERFRAGTQRKVRA